jgi:hypothetical protein
MRWAKFEVLKATSKKMAAFWDVASCTLMMEAVNCFETSLSVYQLKRCNATQDSHLQTVHYI